MGILKERAKRLSLSTGAISEISKDYTSMVEFFLTPEKYCLEFSYLKEVLILKELTAIPGVPDFIQGIINVRGRVMSLMNLRKFLGVKETGITEQNKIMIVSHKGLEIALLVDRISRMFPVSNEDIDPAIPGFGGRGAEFIKGMTSQGIIVLDIATMLESKNIIIQ